MANVSGEDVLKWVMGIIGFIVTGVTVWITNTIFKLKDDSLISKTQITALEAEVKELKHEQAELKKETLTRECVREEIEAALEKRDVTAEKRNLERDKLRRHETKEIVDASLEHLLPRLIREIKGSTGVQKRPPTRPPSSGGSVE